MPACLLRLLPAAILLGACAGDKPPGETGDPPPETGDFVDADGDDWGAAEDCDDHDSAVNPSALELCNGRDDDCDGELDEGVRGTWYADDDADGYGDPESTIESCEHPEGYAPTGSDCDDTDPEVFAGAPERCDGADNDCDGLTDEDLERTWYVDDDGDGWGDAERVTCEDVGEGYVETGGDCDDADEAVNPAAEEICDGIDNDCSGAADDGATDAAAWHEDADGDGYGDPDAETLACEAPEGAVVDATDCDDADPTINPDGEEICDDADNDCDGDVDEAWLDTDLDDGLSGALTLNGDARWTSLGTDGFLRLTDVEDGDDVAYDEAGSAMFSELVDVERWRVSFTFEIADGAGATRPDGREGSGGDGLAFVLLDGEGADFLGDGGEHLGYLDEGATGLAIELDTYCNADYGTSDCYYVYSDYGDPSANHLAMVDVATMEHLAWEDEIPLLEDTGAYGVIIDYERGLVSVTLSDGTDSWTLSEDLPFTPSGGLRLGFTAGTGWEINRHEIDDLALGCP